MSLFWWGAGEDIEFAFRAPGVVSSNSQAGSFRSTFVRGCLQVRGALPTGTGKLADTMPLAAPITSGWLSTEWWANDVSSESPSLGMGNSGNTLGGFFIGPTVATPNKLALYLIDTAGAITKVASEPGTSLTGGLLTRVDIQFTNWNNAATNIKVFLAGNVTAQINWTGDTTGIFANLDCLRYMSNGTNNLDFISEIMITDEDTRSLVGVAVLFPNADGDINTFDAGTYQDVDELVLDDSDMISSGSNGQEFTCGLSDLPAGNYQVRGVKMADRADKAVVGPGTQQFGIRSGGVDNTVNQALLVALANYERLMVLNPITGNPWTVAEVNALQACIKSAA